MLYNPPDDPPPILMLAVVLTYTEAKPAGAAAFCKVWKATNAQEYSYEDAEGLQNTSLVNQKSH